ncbi:MAG: glycosyltransferase [Ilumatobacteraceae bacterium]
MPVRDASVRATPPTDHRRHFGMVSDWDASTAAGRFAIALAGSLEPDHLTHRIGLVAPIDPHTHPSVAVAVRSSRAVADDLRQDDVAIIHVDGLDGGDPDGEPAVSDRLLDVIELVHIPTIVVLHRVPAAPAATQRLVLGALCGSADAVVVTSAPAAVRLAAGYGVDPSALWLIRADHHVRRPAATLLTWGVVSAGSGIEWMVDAMEHLQGLDVRYLVTGPGVHEETREAEQRYRHMLEQRSWLHGVASRITFEADDDDQTALTEQLGRATAVIIPADVPRDLPDGFPDEILAAGVPVIATDLSGLRDIRRVGGGLFVPPHDASALADAAVRIMIDPHLGATMVARAAELCPPAGTASIGAQFDRVAGSLTGERGGGVLPSDVLLA